MKYNLPAPIASEPIDIVPPYGRYNVYPSPDFDHKVVSDVLTSIQKRIDNLVWDCLQKNGFSQDYVKHHQPEFHLKILRTSFTECVYYYHKDTMLFIIYEDFEICDNTVSSGRVEGAWKIWAEMEKTNE